MNTRIETALARLRAADPMPADAPVSDQDVGALLRRILDTAAEPAAGPARRSRPRRLVLAGAFVGAAAATTTVVAGVVPLPWSAPSTSTAAYAVTENGDGSVDVTVDWDQLRDPDALNALLAQAGVRAAVLPYSQPGSCTTPVPLDPAHSSVHVDMREHPELANDPRALAEYLRSLTPWITPGRQSADTGDRTVFTIHPDKIPSGDLMLVVPGWSRPVGAVQDALTVRSYLVPTLPDCVPPPEESVLTRDAIEIRPAG